MHEKISAACAYNTLDTLKPTSLWHALTLTLRLSVTERLAVADINALSDALPMMTVLSSITIEGSNLDDAMVTVRIVARSLQSSTHPPM